jgi:hypothetical protein
MNILKNNPPIWFWSLTFLVSIFSVVYLGLSPELINTNLPFILAAYNVLMSLLAVYYIFINTKKIKHNYENNVVGSNFTWSFIKIIPILTLLPMLSFYIFSFQSIQDNLKKAARNFDNFNNKIVANMDDLYKNTHESRFEIYFNYTFDLFSLINSVDSKNEEYKNIIDSLLNRLVQDGLACKLSLFNSKNELIVETENTEQCFPLHKDKVNSDKHYIFIENEKDNLIQIKLHLEDIEGLEEYNVLSAIYPSNTDLTLLLRQLGNFKESIKNAKLEISTTIIETRFLIDFSTTILLTILIALVVVLKMIDKFMLPMNNLSAATKEIAKGNYDILVYEKEKSDINQLIVQFNEMARKIRDSRHGLDTHNLYLETILKYSYGVIGLDEEKRIRFINPIIRKMLLIKEEQQFINKTCDDIVSHNKYLQPLFKIVQDNLDENIIEWSKEIELPLDGKNYLLICQGATLEANDKVLGYVIIVQDISKLSRAQKKAAWGEIAVRMAHEIKNPLTPILLSAQRLRNNFLDNLNNKDLEIIDKTTNVIIEQVESINSMVSAFADYANIPTIKRKLVDLNLLINQSIALYDAQDFVIEFDLSGDIPKLLLDSNSISRVLINLVKNSTESTEKKDDLVVNISTRYSKAEGSVYLVVKDNGDGFSDSVIDDVFEPYVTTKVKGSGLGMAIVQNIIEQHDGKIFASNIKPNGAMITIKFNYKE